MPDQYPPGVELEEIPCPLDGNTRFEPVIEGSDIINGVPGNFRVVKCTQCGLMRTSPRPTLETMGIYYPDDYRPFESSNILPAPAKTGAVKRLLKRLVHFNVNPIPEISTGTMLEIGSAAGNYLREMAQSGWQVEGIEPSPHASAIARGLGFEVYTGALETAPEKDAVYDLIVGWMVLEHLHEPVEALKRLHRWAKPKSWAVFSVPNAGSLEFRIFGKSWYALQVPTHTFHYTPKTIEQVLAQGGWRLEKVYHQRVLTNIFMSLGYWLKSRGADNRLTTALIHFNRASWRVHQLLYPLAWLLSLFGQTGRMTVWATRSDD